MLPNEAVEDVVEGFMDAWTCTCFLYGIWLTQEPACRLSCHVVTRSCCIHGSHMSRFISSHLISSSPFGVYPSVAFHAPGSLIKCRGRSVLRPPGIRDYFRIYKTSCCQKQNSHKHPEFSSRRRISQNSPESMFRISQDYRFFMSRFQRVIHDSCSPSNHVIAKHWAKQRHAVTSLFCRSLVACWTAGNADAVVCFCQHFSGNCTERRETSFGFMLKPAKHHTSLVTPTTHVQRHLSTTFHATSPHWAKQHLAVNSLVCRRSLVACWPAGNSDAVVCFCQPSSLGIAVNAVKLRLVLCWSRQHHTSLVTPTAHVHRHLGTTLHVTTQHWAKQHLAVASLVCRSMVACWTAGNSDAVVRCYLPFPQNLCWMPWNLLFFLMLEQATQRHKQLSTMFHVTTQDCGKQHATLRTIFWHAKSCPSGLVCVESPESKGISRGATAHLPMLPNEAMEDVVEGFMDAWTCTCFLYGIRLTQEPACRLSCHVMHFLKVMLHTW